MSKPPQISRSRKRIGFFLKAVADHTETYATIPFFACLDKNKYETYLYATMRTNSDIEHECINSVDHFIELGADIVENINRIRSDDLDLLLIGTNATAIVNDSVVLGCFRAARKQVVQFCQPCTTGLENIDAFIVGEEMQLSQSSFTEKLYTVPGSGICFYPGVPEKSSVTDISRDTYNISSDCVLLTSGANYYKFKYELLDAWTILLAENPSAHLALFPFGPAWARDYPEVYFQEQIHLACKRNNVGCDRISVLKPFPKRSDVRDFIALSDVYLDSFPYSGATSLLDPFSLAIPVVAMDTHSVCGGQGAGMLKDCGLHELVAEGRDEYLRITGKLITDKQYRNSISDQITSIMKAGAPFYDMEAFGSKVQAVYDCIINDNPSANNKYNDGSCGFVPTDTTNEALMQKKKDMKVNDRCPCGSGKKFKHCCSLNS